MDIEEIIEDLKNCPKSVRGYVQELKESNRRNSELLEAAKIVVYGLVKESKATKTGVNLKNKM